MAFVIKRHDLRPRFRVRLTQSDPSNPAVQVPVDLSDATAVKFIMSNSTGSTVAVTAPAVFVDRTGGVVEYVWQSGNTDTPGDYNVEFEVMWVNEPQTFPSNGFFTCRINPDLG